MTTCDGNSVDFVSGSSSFESNGIFDAGSYEYIVTDSYGDGLNSNAAVVQTRTIGASNAAWTDLVTVGDFTGLLILKMTDRGSRYFTVNAGDEMKIAYNCPTSGCWPSENSATVKQAPSSVLPAIGPVQEVHRQVANLQIQLSQYDRTRSIFHVSRVLILVMQML